MAIALFLFSCGSKKQQISSQTSELIGTWQVKGFSLVSSFTLSKEKVDSTHGSYQMEFTPGGEIEVLDLNRFYGCGNGVMQIKEASWRQNKTGNYILTFNGEYIVESSFRSQAEYELIPESATRKSLNLVRVIQNERKLLYDLPEKR